MSLSEVKIYPIVRGLRGDQGENETAIAVAAVLNPSNHYPDCGRIIVSEPKAGPGEYFAPIGAFSGGSEAVMRVADLFQQVAADVDQMLDAESPEITIATGRELRMRRRRRGDGGWHIDALPARCEVCWEELRAGDHVQNFQHDLPTEWDEHGEAVAFVLTVAYVHADPCHERDAAPARSHLIGGEFQSDKYPTCPRGKVPLSCSDKAAQDLLWEYAQRRRPADAEFSSDLEEALRLQGFVPSGLVEPDAGTIARAVADAGTDPLDLAALRKIVAERGPCAGTWTTFPRPGVAHVTIVCGRENWDHVIRWIAACERSLETLIDAAAQHEPADLARTAATPWIPEPVPALWFDRDGCGPDHFYLRLRPMPAESMGGREIPASLGLMIGKGDLVILGRSMIGGGFNMEREQVADLHAQLGAWLAGRPLKRFGEFQTP